MSIVQLIAVSAFFSVFGSVACAQVNVLPGIPGSGTGGVDDNRWCAAWWDLLQTSDFAAGDSVCINVLALENDSILVRLLHQDGTAGSAAGIVGGIRQIPQNNAVLVPLTRPYLGIRQISVHGCKWAFGSPLPNDSDIGRLTITGASVVFDAAQCQ
ncbi:MAG: hypothetical protein QNJ44_13130 [Rhodobacter sp.]|nr:hypothetical protein [Rhodobacter sp.]